MTNEHIISEERVLRDWYNIVTYYTSMSTSLLSGIVELPHTLYVGNIANLSWFLSRKPLFQKSYTTIYDIFAI